MLDALSRVDLSEHGGTPIHRLSGGQRKRAALAAELLGDPKLILLDEATSGLDPATEAEMMELFRALAREGRTVVCITHFPGRLHMCDRLLYLMKGKCVFDGTPEQLKRFFGVTTIEGAYTSEDAHEPGEWQAEFRKSSVGQSAAARLSAVPAWQEPLAALPRADERGPAAAANGCSHRPVRSTAMRRLQEPAATFCPGPCDRTDARRDLWEHHLALRRAACVRHQASDFRPGRRGPLVLGDGRCPRDRQGDADPRSRDAVRCGPCAIPPVEACVARADLADSDICAPVDGSILHRTDEPVRRPVFGPGPHGPGRSRRWGYWSRRSPGRRNGP